MKNLRVDPNVNRKNDIIKNQSNIKKNKFDFLPSIIEFSTSGLCNRKCIFCPRSAPDYEHINGHLSLENIEKLSFIKRDLIIFEGRLFRVSETALSSIPINLCIGLIYN